MACPSFDFFIQPVLEFYGDGKIHQKGELLRSLKESLNLPESDLTELVTSGKVTKFKNRVDWSISYLYKAGLLIRPGRALYQISTEGKELLSRNIPINKKTLENYDSFLEFQNKAKKSESNSGDDKDNIQEITEVLTPDELIENAYEEINDTLGTELLEEVNKISDTAFEKLVLDLLHKMGYGKFEDSTMTTQRSHDHGIDGIILEDKLGFNKIYVQAKAYKPGNNVSVGKIREFIGALHNREGKGLFVTTSNFTREAIVQAQQGNIILINGTELANYMIEYDFGVSPKATYQIKKIDTDFFDDYIDIT